MKTFQCQVNARADSIDILRGRLEVLEHLSQVLLRSFGISQVIAVTNLQTVLLLLRSSMPSPWSPPLELWKDPHITLDF